MAEFKVKKAYWYTLENTFQAESAEEAEEMFDDDTCDWRLKNSYQGLLLTHEYETEEV